MLNLYPIIVTIQEKTEERQAGGIYKTTWTDLQDIECQFAPITDDKRLEAMKEIDNAVFEMFVDYLTHQDIEQTIGDKLTDNARVKKDGRIFEFRGQGKNLGGRQEVYEYTLKEVVNRET